jgi:hypothetical protein
MVILLGLWRLVPLERFMQTDLARTLFFQRDHHLPGAVYLTQNLAMEHDVVARASRAGIAIPQPRAGDPRRLTSSIVNADEADRKRRLDG